MPKRPRPRLPDPNLKARIDAACCPEHGLTPAQYDRHKYQIQKIIEHATSRPAAR